MRMSMSTTSGSSLTAAATASAPSLASPTTSMSSSSLRMELNPARTRAWSSATSTRMGAITIPSAQRDAGPYPPPGTVDRSRLAGAAKSGGPLLHAPHPVTASREDGRPLLPVIHNLDDNYAVAGLDSDLRLAGGGVAQHIREPLLDDAIRSVADARGQRGRHSGHFEVDVEAAGLDAGDQVGEAGHVLDGMQRDRPVLCGAQGFQGG